VPIKNAFNRIAEIIEDMEAVCHLHCLRDSARGSLSVGGAPIPRHDLDAGMGVQPVGQACSRPIRKQVDGSALLSIDQDRAIRVPPPLAPIVDAQHAWYAHRRQG